MTWFYITREADAVCEVQILDKDADCLALGRFAPKCSILAVEGTDIPSAVLAAASELPVGGAEYVDPTGHLLDIWGNPKDGKGPISDQAGWETRQRLAARSNGLPLPG